jgi:hypothetical protein
MAPAKGRLVRNHSTHVRGLMPVLEKLTQVPGIRTVTPGVIASIRGQSPQLQLRISTPIQGGFKLIARRGKSVQEVFILTTLCQEELQMAIANLLD